MQFLHQVSPPHEVLKTSLKYFHLAVVQILLPLVGEAGIKVE